MQPCLRTLSWLAVLLCTTAALAAPPASRPIAPSTSRDDDIFGSSTPEPKTNKGAASKPTAAPAKTRTEDRLLGKLFDQGKDKLQLGGLLYMRFNLALTTGKHVDDHTFSMPNLMDVFLDARPSDRVRAFVRGRLLYTPTQGVSFLPGVSTDPLTVQLNELWLKFDIARRVYVTIGSQLVLWGTTRLWNPVDFINQTQRPILSPFDARNGVPMVKLQLPIESLGWNFYLIGLLDQVSTLDKGGVVGRGEFVFSTVEVGLTGAYRGGIDPRVGLDVSAGVWDLELRGELSAAFDERYDHKVTLRASAALEYSVKVFDDDVLLLGGEYFYNQQGTDVFDVLELASGKRQFFYVGKHYGAAFISLPRPGRWDNWSFTLSGVGNLSDLSFIGRLDVSYTFLTFITVQAFAVLHFGKQGELRIGENVFSDPAVARALLYPDDPTRRIPTQAVDLGLWLRVNL